MLKDLTVKPKKQKEKEKTIPSALQLPEKEAIESFIESIENRFLTHEKPLCNAVPKWEKKTVFYINSYHKLSLITKNKSYKQLSNPSEIYQFWPWLSLNPERIGDKIDFTKASTLKKIKKCYFKKEIIMRSKKYWINNFITLKRNSIKLQIQNQNKQVAFMLEKTSKKEKLFSLKEL